MVFAAVVGFVHIVGVYQDVEGGLLFFPRVRVNILVNHLALEPKVSVAVRYDFLDRAVGNGIEVQLQSLGLPAPPSP